MACTDKDALSIVWQFHDTCRLAQQVHTMSNTGFATWAIILIGICFSKALSIELWKPVSRHKLRKQTIQPLIRTVKRIKFQSIA
jgi:hypothetical protein